MSMPREYVLTPEQFRMLQRLADELDALDREEEEAAS